MPQLPIVPFGDAAAIILPVDVLESLGLHIGDILDVTGGDRHLILRPSEDTTRRQLMETLTQEVFERRQDAYRRLA